MRNRRNYYRILQVQPDAPLEVIKASYRTLMRELKRHPDLGGDHWDAKVLNEAYATLSHPQRRAAYDKQLYRRYTKNKGSEDARQPLVTDFCPFCKRPLARQAVEDGSCPNCNSPFKTAPQEEPDESTRRSVARIKKSGTIRYYTSWPQKGKQAQLADISPTGMRFLSFEKLRIGTPVKITCPELSASAKVVNVLEKDRKDGNPVFEIGVVFLAVTFANVSGNFLSVRA